MFNNRNSEQEVKQEKLGSATITLKYKYELIKNKSLKNNVGNRKKIACRHRRKQEIKYSYVTNEKYGTQISMIQYKK